MARTMATVKQTPWDCRWSQPGHQLTGVDEDHQPEGRWVCTRSMPEGVRRTVTDEECATCAHWQAEDSPQASRFAAPEFALPDVSGHVARNGARRSLLLGTGVALLAMGLGLVGTVVMLPVGVAFLGIGVAMLAAGAKAAELTS